MKDFKGFWALVLHSHLPFVKHPEYPDFLEEDWFYEAMNETYIPLLRVFEGLANDGIDFRVTISLTPPLLAMMEDELLNTRFKNKLLKLIEFSEKEVIRTKYTPFYETAKMYERIFKDNLAYYEKYGGRIINAYKKLQDSGFIEIITCGATHGFLPLKIHRQAMYAQIKVAVKDYEKKFGRKPLGIWLAECAYTYGVDEILKKCGIKFFFVEAHGILYGEPRPRYGIYAPVYTKEGVAAFGRDMETAHQVWSADFGYPGDPDYREFYRDAGYDLDYDYVRPYLHSDGVRRNIGVKYYRITGKVPLNKKEPYNPVWAMNKAYIHAGNFLFNREQQIMHLSGIFDRQPVVVSPYDCELFGHWWFEGPWFLNSLFRKIHELKWKKIFKAITPLEYLGLYPKNQILTPSPSSWGDKGYFEVWLNGTNDWIYRHLHKGAELVVEAATRFRDEKNPVKIRVLNQMARELLLAQASDWAFIMTTGTMVQYAVNRTKEHISNLLELESWLKNGRIDENKLSYLENKNSIFKDIDYRVFAEEV